MTLVGLLMWLIICGTISWAVDRLMGAFGVADPQRTVILVLCVLLMLVTVLDMTDHLGPLLHFHR